MDEIINLFTKEHGSYKQVFKLHTILFFLVVLIIITKLDLFNKSVFALLALMFTLYVTELFVRVTKDELSDSNKIIRIKLESLQAKIYQYVRYKVDTSSVGGERASSKDLQLLYQKNNLDALYIDANMIEFLYSIIKLYDYNPSEFYLLVKGTNNVLKLRHDIERFYESENKYPENVHEMLQIAVDIKVNCMNNVQNFIYNVPKMDVMYKYVDSIIEVYTVLINKNIKKIHSYSIAHIKSNGVNTSTIFTDINTTKPYDSLSNHSLIPGKLQNKHSLIDLYV